MKPTFISDQSPAANVRAAAAVSSSARVWMSVVLARARSRWAASRSITVASPAERYDSNVDSYASWKPRAERGRTRACGAPSSRPSKPSTPRELPLTQVRPSRPPQPAQGPRLAQRVLALKAVEELPLEVDKGLILRVIHGESPEGRPNTVPLQRLADEPREHEPRPDSLPLAALPLHGHARQPAAKSSPAGEQAPGQ